SEIDIDKLTKALQLQEITQEDIAGLMKDQASDLKKADLDKLAGLAGSAASGLELKTFEGGLRKFATGGPVGMSGPAHLTAGEMVLDNNAALLFVKAADILSGQDLSGPKLADLQRESIATMTTGGGSNVVVSAPTTTQISSSSAMALPVMPIQPSNGETSLNG
ncbi:uncharacterized protein METZ01_LOCUS359085, partial [marine metagenome]